MLEPLDAGRSAGNAARVRLAAIELESGSPAERASAAGRRAEAPPTAEALAVNAQLLMREGKRDEAHGARRALPRSTSIPESPSAHYVVGTIELERGHTGPAPSARSAKCSARTG